MVLDPKKISWTAYNDNYDKTMEEHCTFLRKLSSSRRENLHVRCASLMHPRGRSFADFPGGHSGQQHGAVFVA
ncbi:hypothetical protein MPTK1_2g18700 [Marchantia polymorpha subsp. ruderalis]|uniref:Uncharacterized protein n=1 Tax=Marchantia polymorpha TaxID=3197 RepID=A0A2R6W721_MARPO|nr:hypothetical protein MARPO_0137s0012 [Marchantia polymorpha]BBN02852.1 hypothetical protein Mp_2g18700 [Marchantia polymorpha subsp. ruderalis]|eukprot:PTQ29644.1 hypothetical protein MARPO_0137s0012 [Marchantia polymorpha]